MTITAQTMLTTAVRRLTGAQGYTLSTNEQADFLPVLNAMLEAWSLERLMVYQILQENFALVAGTASYTIGSGATFNTTRPIKIVKAFVRDSSNLDSPVDILGFDAYDSIVQKSSGNTYPEYLFNDCAYASGLATLRLYPKPIAGLTLYIDSWKQLQQFAAISTAISLPPGYQRAIEWNLCLELADEYGKTPTPLMLKNATDSKARIKTVNAPDTIMRLDAGVAGYGRANILTGV